MLFLSVEALAGNIYTLDTEKSGAWESGLFANNANNHFCAAETVSKKGTLFRINFYLANNDSFVEVFNSAWSFRTGTLKFDLLFDNKFGIELRGTSEGTGFTHDLLRIDQTRIMIGALAGSKTLQILDSNGSVLDTFPLNGSRDAMRKLRECKSDL